MVGGYYHNKTIPRLDETQSPRNSVSPTLEVTNSVKRLVCSPDIAMLPSSRQEPISNPLLDFRDEKGFRCRTCNKTFRQKNTYQSHLRSHSKEGEDPHQCNVCFKTFAVPARLTRHYRTHTGEKPFECEYCKKPFSVKENLSVHRRIHTKERPYKCDVCGRAFEHSGKLHRHMRIHTGERPHECNICSKTFIQSGQLVIHMRTHTGEKPYVCKTCNKGFTCSKQLKVHTRTHTGEKPYTCETCGKSFGYNHVLKLHQVAHYGSKIYQCTLCNGTFNSKKSMEVHIKTHSDSTLRNSPVDPAVKISMNMNCISNNSSSSNTDTSNTVVSGSSNGNASTSSDTSSSSSNKENKITDEPTLQGLTDFARAPEFVYFYQQESPYPMYNQQNLYLQRQHLLTAVPSIMIPSSSVDSSAMLPPPQMDSAAMMPPPPMDSPVIPANENVNGTIENARSHQISVIASPLNYYQHREMIPAYGYGNREQQVPVSNHCATMPELQLEGVFARMRVEAALEAVEEEDRRREFIGNVEPEPLIITPTSSVTVSPASTPDPLEVVAPTSTREAISLPPRKRCKMILESMQETERTEKLAAQRKSSVIRFAHST